MPYWLWCAAASAAALPAVYYAARWAWELVPQRLDRSLSAVFISGCDTGFGRLLALKCAHEGFSVYAGCLSEEGAVSLSREAQYLKGKLVTVSLDITNDASVKKAHEIVTDDIAKTPEKVLWALVNNAGVFSIYGPDAWCSIDEYQRAVNVNTFGAIRCTHAFLLQIKKSRGRIITTTSVSGRVATPFSGPYCVAKFGSEAYMDVIRMELKDFGVTCSIIEPGIFRTDLLNDAQMTARCESVWAPLSVELKTEYGVEFKNKFLKMWNKFMLHNSSTRLHYVVDAYFHAIAARYPRLRYRCGFDANFLYIPLTFAPTALVDYLLTNSISKRDKPTAAVLLKNDAKMN